MPNPGYYPDNPRSSPPTPDEQAAMFAEPTPADSLDECAHGSACVRALGLLMYGGEVNTDAFGWMDDCAAALGCADCDQWERR